ncbi:MAG: alpha/beta hydrolase [Bosea sp.]|jgi:pimeloyl-ACP methyl ester carboxylesterase|nr:alpha/beta hydrolase [Bosea sp. (in: a-proteobacteria)]
MNSFDSAGVAIAYIDLPATGEDKNEPIVLIHGFASNHAVNWVNTSWTSTLTRDGRRVLAFDNRGHGRSQRLHDPAAYHASLMAEDARRLMDHLGIERADVMGYSMGARITAHLALAHPQRMRSALLGGLGIKLIDGVGLPPGIADAMEAPDPATLTDPTQRMFRAFAQSTGSDLGAMAACIRGSRQTLTGEQVRAIAMPVLVSVGTADEIAGAAAPLAALLPKGEVLDIPGRDHNLAVGDRTHKQGVLNFLQRRP